MKLRNKLTTVVMAFFSLTNSIIAQTPKMETIMNAKQQDIVTVAALTAKGEIVPLKAALNKSLDDGMSVNEVKEVLVHSYAYCGFPRALRGLQTLVSVLDERKTKGIE